MKILKLICCVAALMALAAFLTGAYSTKYVVEKRIHTVKIGENLYYIAKEYGPQQDKEKDLRGLMLDIKAANGLKNEEIIYPGQKLVIPLAKEVVAENGR